MKHMPRKRAIRIHGALKAAVERANRRVLKLQALEDQGGECLYCFLPLDPAEATAEHRKARKRGGQDTARNIGASCEDCNRTKGHLSERVFLRAIRRPDLTRDGWDLYVHCISIRLRRRTALACKRLRSIVEARAA